MVQQKLTIFDVKYLATGSTIADEPFQQFELFMKMYRDFCSCNFNTIGEDAERWIQKESELGRQYEKNYAFLKSDRNWAVCYFTNYIYPSYTDAARIQETCEILARIPEWRCRIDRNNEGEKQVWFKLDMDDSLWEKTNPCLQNWSDMGLWSYYGPVWYRNVVKLLKIPAGKKVYLWVSTSDGELKVFVNGKHVSYATVAGKYSGVFSGYCLPASFNITDAVKSEAENQITIVGTRTSINELGTGGIMGPVLIYRER